MQKALLTNALLFGLLAVAYDRPAQRDNSHPNDAQEPLKSLGEIAKEAKKNKAVRAKTVITEETLYSHKGPLPKLDLEGPENYQDIVQAIGDYKSKHTDQQTEDMVHDWYREYDSMLATIFREKSTCNRCGNRTPITATRPASRALTTRNAWKAKGRRPVEPARTAR